MNTEQAEMQILNSQAQMIAEHIEKLDAGLIEIEVLKSHLDELRSLKKDTKILAPMSNGIFVKAKLEENDKLLVNVGNGVVVEKTAEQTKELLDERLNEMQEGKEKMIFQIKKIEDRLKAMSKK